ncbi:hypothetical protein E5288_WYG011512 [Bos mutus]|uniref:Uncharacterized protein n=1 Tax=Bos mutus TaxID=72004 RepID=A0A6B0RJT4_9CETA|nr:hypothetical protein [Bos mutus]
MLARAVGEPVLNRTLVFRPTCAAVRNPKPLFWGGGESSTLSVRCFGDVLAQSSPNKQPHASNERVLAVSAKDFHTLFNSQNDCEAVMAQFWGQALLLNVGRTASAFSAHLSEQRPCSSRKRSSWRSVSTLQSNLSPAWDNDQLLAVRAASSENRAKFWRSGTAQEQPQVAVRFICLLLRRSLAGRLPGWEAGLSP